MKKTKLIGLVTLFLISGTAAHAVGMQPLSFDPSILVPSLDDVLPKHLQRKAQENKIVNEAKRAARMKSMGTSNPYEGLPHEVSLRDRATSIKKQTSPWCTAYGLAAVMEINADVENLSERHIWSNYRQYSCEVAIESTQGEWITTEEYWPIYNRRPYYGYDGQATVAYTEYKYLNSDIRSALETMAAGRAVYLGMSVNKSMGDCNVMVDAKSANTGGGHAIAIVGYKLDESLAGGGALLIKNSWGDSCADKGYQWIPFAYCERSDSYCEFWDVTKIEKRAPSSGDEGGANLFTSRK